MIDTSKAKSFDDMTEDEKRAAIYSAHYILEDVSIKDFVRITGLPEGVVAAAYENIFKN